MTISYSAYVTTSAGFPSAFMKLLRRWRGSIWKLIYCDLLVFLGMYYSLNLCYRFAMTPHQQEHFADVVSYFSQYNSRIPIIFVLGFYISLVMKRWSRQIYKKPWPNSIAMLVSALVRGKDIQSQTMRRTVMRYVNLSYILVFRLISPKVKKRFPTYDTMIDAGVLLENEKKIIEALDNIYPKLPKYWMPIVWATSILTRARQEGKIRDDFALRTLNDAINSFREACIMLLKFDTMSIPLVYTQLVTLAVYSYFAASIIGNQWIEIDDRIDHRYTIQYYFPLFSTLEFFFFMGWLKVAETLMCPFGEDDDDFDINAAIDKNIRVSYIIIDELHNRHPRLLKDQFWNEVYPYELPGGGDEHPEYSTMRMDPKPTKLTGAAAVKQQESLAKLLWERSQDRLNMKQQPSSGSEYTYTEEPSEGIMEDDFSDPEECSEEGGICHGMTFERLRAERAYEKRLIKSAKILRSVITAANYKADLENRLSSDLFENSPSDIDNGESKLESQNKQPKKDEETRMKDDDEPKKDDQNKPGNEQKKNDDKSN